MKSGENLVQEAHYKLLQKRRNIMISKKPRIRIFQETIPIKRLVTRVVIPVLDRKTD